MKIRENLTAYPASQQLSFDSFETRSALMEKDQMVYGMFPRRMDRRHYYTGNSKLLTLKRYKEFLDVMAQTVVEFEDAAAVSQFFQKVGIDTRSGNLMEMYLESSDLLCNYCFQLNLDREADDFLYIRAFVK